MLEIKNLFFKYNKKSPLVIDDVSFSLEKGKIGILLGKNGSGKSTLFKLILGILKAEKGEINFDGKSLKDMKLTEKSNIFAYVPQTINFGELNVYDSIMGGRVSHFNFFPSKEDKKIVEKVIKEMGLEEFVDRNVNELSGGERQKIAIARALVQEPKLLIFDEPTGNLDLGNEELIMKEAKKIANEGITILISIHDLNIASRYGDEFFLLKEGKIKYQGNKEILNKENLTDIYGINVSVENIKNKKFIYVGGGENEK